jgi:15-cis-phytoene synthase
MLERHKRDLEAQTRPPAHALDHAKFGESLAQSTRYLAWLYSPEPQRPVIQALCGIENEVAASLRPGLDHHVAHTRVQWWREEFERSTQGRAVHPLTREIVGSFEARVRDPSDSPIAGLAGFADTAIWDLAAATFETRTEVTAYCERWAAAMMEPAATHALANHIPPNPPPGDPASGSEARGNSGRTGPPSAGTVGEQERMRRENWRSLGAALREIEMLTDLAREAHSGRLRLPLDELEQAQVDPAALAKPPWPAPLVALLRGRHEALRASVAASVSALTPGHQPAVRGLLVWAAIGWHLSRRAQRALPNPIESGRLDAAVDGWRAWRAARAAVGGRFQLN